MTIFLRYVLFAIVSTAANLLTQEAATQLVPFAGLTFSMLAGTAVGFGVKYVLDKYWIFYDEYTSPDREARKVLLYGVLSVLTTCIFWGFEIAFWQLWKTDFAKYSGAVLGLAIGYAVKYALDRTYVFTERRA